MDRLGRDHHHLGARYLMIPDKRCGGEAPRGFEAALEARAEQQLIASACLRIF